MARRREDKEQEKTSRLAIQAAANLQLVGAEPEVVDRVVNEILDRRLTDDSSGGTADTLVGRVVIETLTGKPVPAFLPRAGEVARALIDAQANLQLAGIDDTKEARAVTDRIVREGLRGARARAAVREVVAPVVAQVEAAQQGSAEPAAQAQPPADTGREATVPALQDLPAAQVPAASGAGSAGPGTPAPAAATQPAASQPEPSTPSPATGNATSGVITGTLHNINHNADGSGTYDVTITYPDGTTELRHVTVNADGSSTITRGDGTTESHPAGSSAMPPASAEGQTSVVNQDSDGDGNPDSVTSGSDDDNSDDDGDDDDGDSGTSDGDDSQSQNGGDGAEANDASGDQPAASGTPNPEAETGGSGLELHEATGGRLGGDTARRQQDRLDQFSKGGGAAGPEAGEDKASGVLLTPEEQANAARLLGVKAGGGITTPSPLEEGGTAITARDLKDLVLRGRGGAGTPDVVVFPVIQPPQSPLAPPAGVPGVGGDPITGLGTIHAIPTLSSVQRFGAIPLAEMLGGKSVAETSAPAAPLATGTAGFSQVAPEIFGSQVSGFAGVEIQLRGLVAFQAAPLLA